ncbi:uncharacterized protein LOC141647598 isoform X2 [Silene latifolia]|uniref:uncharacterized protein LOC141647598 isoform X2 n=1 Tax=Silene latifolia TaxID=37657 RepID=UPI003D76F37E
MKQNSYQAAESAESAECCLLKHFLASTSRAGRTMSDSHTSSENRRKGEKRRWTDCKSRSSQDGRRRSPRLTSTSHDECNKQPNSNPAAPISSGKLSASECKESQKHGHLYHEESWLPEKHILELVLDTVQRRDTHDIFAEPVDPSEVEEYYEIITEPMDFGTMRAKLYEGLYKNLQQFERDMYLIFENATYFNSSGTVYFRQARTLEDLANKVFHALKTHGPDNFELEFSTMRRRSSRKLDDEHTSSTFGSGQKLAKDLGSNSMNTDINQKGNRRRRRPIISCIDRRCTYEPWKSVLDETNSTISSLNCDTRPVIQVNQENYRKSLMSFVKGLGPTAQRVAERKLQGLWLQNTTSPIPNYSDCSTANPQLSTDPSHFQTDLNNLSDRSVPVSNSQSIHEKTGVSMIRPAPEKGKLHENFSSLSRIPVSNSPSQFQLDLNNPFYRSIPVSNPHYIREKTGVSITGPTVEKGKRPEKPKSLNSKDANSSANLRKCDPDLRDGTIVMGLVASRNRHHQKASVSQCASAKESKQNQARKFDLNQAQPSPTSIRVSKRLKEDGSMPRAIPFGSLAPAEAMHNNTARATPFGSLTPAEAVHNYMAQATPFGSLASAEAVHNNMGRATPFRSFAAAEAVHNNMARATPLGSLRPAEAVHNNMGPLLSRQFLFNEPHLESRINGIGITSSTSVSNTMLPPRLGLGSGMGWPMSSSMSFGQPSSSRECPDRNEYHEKNNRLLNFKL